MSVVYNTYRFFIVRISVEIWFYVYSTCISVYIYIYIYVYVYNPFLSKQINF